MAENTIFAGTYTDDHPDTRPDPVFSPDIVAILHAAGIKTVAAGQSCDATLTVATTIEPRGKKFTEAVTGVKRYCYSGVNITSDWLLENNDAKLQFNLKKQRGTKDTQLFCIEHGTYADELAFVMHSGLDKLWGAQILIPMLDVNQHVMNQNAIYLAGAGGRHRVDAVPALFAYLDDPDLSDEALSALKTITGKNLHIDLFAWTTWWESQATPTP